MPTVIETTVERPHQVFWEARFPRGGAAQFEALHGPGFTYEKAVDELLARPVSLLIYVLAPENADFMDSWLDLERSTFDTYSSTAKTSGCSWRDVKWLFVKARSWQQSAAWMIELIPPELAASALTVDSASGAGIPGQGHRLYAC